MAIWLWILLAWCISLIALKGKKVRLEHFVWLLLPVDMYGLTIAGVTLKPYMIFCGFLLFRMMLSGKMELSVKSRWSLITGVLVLLMISLNAFNNSSLQSLISTVMVAVVWICTMIYMSDSGDRSPEDITEVMLAAGIGFGAVFVMGYFCMELNLNLPGIVADTRAEPGFFMGMNNMYEGKFVHAVRLRGFTIDPNCLLAPFLFSSGISVMRLISGRGRLREILALVLAWWCIILSNSRMGLICCAFIVIISIVVAYPMGSDRCKRRVKLSMLFLITGGILICVTGGFSKVVMSVIANYQNRSGLNDEYGRFTIWKDAANVLIEQNLFFGVGNGQIQFNTAKARACHNTWLEFICAFGLLLGGVVVGHFVAMLVNGGLYAYRSRTDVFAWIIFLGTAGVVLSLVGVDNLTSSYLWFSATMVSSVSAGCWRKKVI